ncbi:hypothetical protein FHR22_001051 [Sphingopyxis panaciterrae]|nr:hypothetical protein [Sphingopyxis panaciterrae]
MLLAAFVGSASSVIANQVKNPAASYAIGVGPTGIAEANLAFASFSGRKRMDPQAGVSVHERQLASRAYRNEPLSSAALGLMIASMPDSASKGDRARLLELGGQLTRRSSLITSASIEAAARDGNQPAFFLWLSRAILTNESLRATYIRAMAQATARPDTEAALAPVIGPNPTWAGHYWKAVVNVPESLVNAAKLRVAVAQSPWRQRRISDTDRMLVSQLAKFRHFDAMRDLVAALSPAEGGAFAANLDFSRPSLLPPVDWQLASSGNLGATIEPKRKILAISAIAGARGYAARQLLQLAPGAYELEWNLAADATIENGTLTARLDCAEKAGSADGIEVSNLDIGRRRTSLTIPGDSCRWYWLSINVNVPDTSAGLDAQFRRISLTPSGQPAPVAPKVTNPAN